MSLIDYQKGFDGAVLRIWVVMLEVHFPAQLSRLLQNLFEKEDKKKYIFWIAKGMTGRSKNLQMIAEFAFIVHLLLKFLQIHIQSLRFLVDVPRISLQFQSLSWIVKECGA